MPITPKTVKWWLKSGAYRSSITSNFSHSQFIFLLLRSFTLFSSINYHQWKVNKAKFEIDICLQFYFCSLHVCVVSSKVRLATYFQFPSKSCTKSIVTMRNSRMRTLKFYPSYQVEFCVKSVFYSVCLSHGKIMFQKKLVNTDT